MMVRRLAGLLIAGCLWAASQPAAAEATLEGTMRALAAQPHRQAAFSEEKAIPELSAPLPSTGTLSWSAPSRLEKHTTWPAEERLLIEGDRLLLERPAQNLRQELSLQQSPDLRPFVEAIRATMAGDLATLQQYYSIDFKPEGEGWRMLLTPLSMRTRAALQLFDFRGKGADLLSIETRASDGTTRLRITPRP